LTHKRTSTYNCQETSRFSAFDVSFRVEKVAYVSKSGNLGSGHPLSPLAKLPGRPSANAAEHSVLGRLYPHAC